MVSDLKKVLRREERQTMLPLFLLRGIVLDSLIKIRHLESDGLYAHQSPVGAVAHGALLWLSLASEKNLTMKIIGKSIEIIRNFSLFSLLFRLPYDIKDYGRKNS
jgi:hypothetical protein